MKATDSFVILYKIRNMVKKKTGRHVEEQNKETTDSSPICSQKMFVGKEHILNSSKFLNSLDYFSFILNINTK